jgi:hypothetical protein
VMQDGFGRDEEDRLIGHVFDRLRHRYPDVPEDSVHEIVDSARRRFDQAPIRDFVPLLVERHTKQELETLVTSVDPA